MEPLVIDTRVDCSPRRAFEVWTVKTSSWWPADHTVSGEPGAKVTVEPRVGGRIFERAGDGTEHDWGEVVVWDPPTRLAYSWHLMVDRSDATEVEITFTADGPGTLVRIEHRGWERLGAAGEERRARNRQGWDGLLPHFLEACTGYGSG
jgi:uncharacterized protein YndB with AHSA1/START domain